MSDIEDYQYWRILKDGATSSGEPIKEGDSVTFSWSFSDQTVGFRDYQDDIFGRRRNQCPPELASETLHLKLPWPRFESLNTKTPNSMVMWPVESAGPVLAKLKCIDERDATKEKINPYLMEAVRFRIDTVANDGKGDTDDYMLKGIQETDVQNLTAWKQRQLIQWNLSFLAAMFFL